MTISISLTGGTLNFWTDYSNSSVTISIMLKTLQKFEPLKIQEIVIS